MQEIDVQAVLEEADKRGIDPRVEVRFGLLTRERDRLSDQEIDRRLMERAQSDSPGASLSDLIKGMVKEVAYGQAKLSLPEFIERFKNNRLADVIASKFAISLFQVDSDPLLAVNIAEEKRRKEAQKEERIRKNIEEKELVFSRAKRLLTEILDLHRHTSPELWHGVIKQVKKSFPTVSIKQLLSAEYIDVDDTDKDNPVIKKLPIIEKAISLGAFRIDPPAKEMQELAELLDSDIQKEEPRPDVAIVEKTSEDARKKVVVFLEKFNLSGSETLFEFLKQLKSDIPTVDMSRLFLEEYTERLRNPKLVKDPVLKEKIKTEGSVVRRLTLKEKVAEKIVDNIDRLASEAYQEKFNEDKRGFVMGYMMRRVIKYDAVKQVTQFDEHEFRKLMEYLDSIGYAVNRINGETLYDWLYSDSRQMSLYAEEQKVGQTVSDTRGLISAANVPIENEKDAEKGKLFFEKDFDVKVFHDKYIKPALFKFYSKKLRKLVKIREPDLLHKLNDPDNNAQRNYTVQLIRYIEALVNTAKADSKNRNMFLLKVREVFGLNDSPLLGSLSNAQVEKYFAVSFALAELKYSTNVEAALDFRSDPQIHEACKYPDELLKCRKLEKVLEWFINPQSFVDDFPQYKDWPLDRIAFSCSAFIRDFLKVTKELSNKQFKDAYSRRDMVEKFIIKALRIKFKEIVDLDVKLLEELDDDGKPLATPVYEEVFDAQGISEFVEENVRNEMSAAFYSKEDVVLYRGKKYRAMPNIEVKRYQMVDMAIPVIKLNDEGIFEKMPRVKAKALVYIGINGDGHLIHVKKSIDRLGSQDRGKLVTDEIRWKTAFSTPQGAEAFSDFMYSSHARKTVKIDDPKENRNMTIKPQVTLNRSEASKEFKMKQSLAITKVLAFPNAIDEEGMIEMVDALLETQVEGLKMLIRNDLSALPPTGHDYYRSERAWPVFFNLYFPPEYFGDLYKKFMDDGFVFPK